MLLFQPESMLDSTIQNVKTTTWYFALIFIMASEEETHQEEFVAEFVVDDELLEIYKSFELTDAAIEQFVSKYFYVIFN